MGGAIGEEAAAPGWQRVSGATPPLDAERARLGEPKAPAASARSQIDAPPARPPAQHEAPPEDDLQIVCQQALHAACEALELDLALVLQRDESAGEARPIASFARTGLPLGHER